MYQSYQCFGTWPRFIVDGMLLESDRRLTYNPNKLSTTPCDELNLNPTLAAHVQARFDHLAVP